MPAKAGSKYCWAGKRFSGTFNSFKCFTESLYVCHSSIPCPTGIKASDKGKRAKTTAPT